MLEAPRPMETEARRTEETELSEETMEIEDKVLMETAYQTVLETMETEETMDSVEMEVEIMEASEETEEMED